MTTSRLVPVPAGDDLMPALSSIEPGCWLQASGHLEGVEIKLPGEALDLQRTLRGRLVLVSLAGPSGGPFTVTLARHTDAGIEVLGGVLTRARSQGVTLFVQSTAVAPREPGVRREVVEVAPAVTSPAAAPAAPSAVPGAAPSAPAPPVPVSPRTWAEVAAASDDAEVEEEDLLPERGDLVDHFAFGLCDVIKANGDRLQIRDVKGSGRIREVVLSALKVMPPRPQGNKRCFRLQRRG
jgi:hypothetical protein